MVLVWGELNSKGAMNTGQLPPKRGESVFVHFGGEEEHFESHWRDAMPPGRTKECSFFCPSGWRRGFFPMRGAAWSGGGKRWSN